ncbi:hypothetical protein RHOER0001_5014 [Rhodococcus erythropolis SK121]|nr:hypothetical protein RHOER0001_5014 [Rhodococcus erythropolis SK121]
MTSPGPKPTVSPRQQAANQLAEAHGDVPAGFTGNVPIPPDPNEPDEPIVPAKSMGHRVGCRGKCRRHNSR